jgi:Tfp pilus assembly protein PilF
VSFLAFGFALLSKPTAVTLPFTLLLVEFWPLRSWKSPGELIGRLPAISPFFALTLVFSVLTYWGQREAGAMAMYGGTGLAERLANAGYGFAMYLWKTLWPAGLALNPPIASPPAAVVALGGMLFAAGSALAVWRAREWPWLFAGWFWFAGTLVPSLGLVQTGEQAFADRYSYVPHIGLFALAVAGAVHLLGAERWKSAPGQAAVAVLLLVLAWRAHGQTSYWRDPITQFEHTVAVSPGHSQGRQVLARSYLRLKRHDAAERHINAAIGANPGDPESHRILAEILFQRGDNEKSLARLTDAERVAPNSALTQFNRGIVLREMGRNEEAAAAYAKAIELGLMPDRRAEAWYSMGLAQNKANQTDRAVASFQKALEIDPYHYFARKNLAFAYMRLQDYAKAQPHFELLLRANETDEDVVRSLQFLRNRR